MGLSRFNGIFVLLVVAGIMFSASACTNTSNNGGSGQVFQGGTNGLILNFMSDAPPSTVYDNGQSPFSIIVTVKNDGEYDVNNIHFEVSGLNPNEFSGLTGHLTKDYTTPLTGKTKLQDKVIEGDSAYVTLADNVKYSNTLKGGGELPQTLLVSACYPYATVATSQVCLQSNYLDGDNSVCDPSTTNKMSVSAAPLQFTSFSQTAVAKNKLRLQYKLEMKSTGQIYAPTSGQECSTDRQNKIEQQNWVYVTLDANNNGQINCVNLLGPQQKSWNAQNLLDVGQTYATGNSILVRHITDTSGGKSGWVKLGPDGTATLTCTLTEKSNTVDSMGTVDVAAMYYIRQSATTSFTVSHSG